MAEGRDYDYNEASSFDPNDYDVDEEQINTTKPFEPVQASTPHHSEQIEMQTMQHEQSGLPSYVEEETSFGGEQRPLLGEILGPEEKNRIVKKTKDLIKKFYPKVDFAKIQPIGYSKKGKAEVVTFGPRGGEGKIEKEDGKGLQKSFTDKFLEALGPRAEQIIAEDRDTIQEQRQRLVESRNEEREAEKNAAEIDKELREMENLKQQTERTQARIDAIQEEYGSNLESEAELRRLKLLKKNYQTDYENKKKEVAELEKKAKNKQKVQEKVQKERAKLDEMVKKRNLIEKRLNSTKPLDDLNEREAELRQQNAEDQAIIDATDASPSERQAAEERVEERNEGERVKEIFKKNGVTVTAILLAAGVTIGTVISALTKGLKATGKAVAGGLKEIAAKLGSLLPGLIGQVARFIFNTTAKAVGFLAEHTWLLILAAVAFVFEKYIKKRR